MLDLSHIPNNQENIKIFYSNGIANAWQTWQKPRKCQWVWIMTIGGGAGGAGGFGTWNLLGVNGGGSGAVTRALFNASHLPDTLYVQVGLGGVGGLGAITNGGAGEAGSSGNKSNVSMLPNIIAANVILSSGNTAAVGGEPITGASSAGETAMTATVAAFATLANFISTVGRASTVISGNTGDVTPLTSQIVSAGAGGGMANTPAGSIFSSSISPLIPGGAGTSTVGIDGGNGGNGITSWKPFFSTGGSGGGSSASGSGGIGGNGGIGSGGGGGGSTSSIPTYTAGRGGKGGDGLVVIIAF